MSAELRVLRDPVATFHQLAASPDRGAWTMLRRPLLLMLAMGLVLSVASSTRVSPRAVVDGMISFAFVPIVEILALGVVYLRTDRAIPFTRAVDLFLLSNAPWLLWILGFCIWQAVMTPTVILDKTGLSFVVSLVVPAAWAAYLDLQFFRIVMTRGAGSAAIDLTTTRVIGWLASVGYFFGIALWAQIVAWLR